MRDDLVCVHVHQGRLELLDLGIGQLGERGNDDQVARLCAVRGAAVHRNDAGAFFGAQRVGDEALAVVDVPRVDLLVLADARGIEQRAVDGDGAFVVELGVSHRGTVDLALEHVQVHDFGFRQGQPA